MRQCTQIENGIALRCACSDSRSRFSQQKVKLCVYEGLEIFHYRHLREKHILFWEHHAAKNNTLHHTVAYNA